LRYSLFYRQAKVKRIYKEGSVATAARQLRDLISVGPAMLRDFHQLGIHSVTALARQDPAKMYRRLERLTGQRQDPCVLDTFCAAVAQARNPRLPAEKCPWWYWSRKRKA
jgi:pathogenicity locus Cdd1 protein